MKASRIPVFAALPALCALCALSLGLPLRAQDLATPASAPAPAPASGVERELAQLNGTLSESNELLRRLVSQQEATLYLRRLELASDRVEQAELRLRSLQAELSGVEQHRLMMSSALEQMEQTEEDAPEELLAGLARERASLDQQLKSSAVELGRLEIDLVMAENEVQSRRDRHVELQELLDAAIGRLLQGR